MPLTRSALATRVLLVVPLGMFVVLTTALVSPSFGDTGHVRRDAAPAPGHSPEDASIHGGQVTMTQHFHVETSFSDESMRVYLYDAKQNPLSIRGVSGTAQIEGRGGHPQTVDLTYFGPLDGKTGDDFLLGSFAFSKLRRGRASISLSLTGLPDRLEKSIRIAMKFPGISRPKVRAHETEESGHGEHRNRAGGFGQGGHAH